ncbi:MAG: TIGR01212 family radical SAM protein [Acutalibacteraceae bacterium]|jgi:radical SAM protein (TIGR01212 family)|nr:TIGR01212 family radical SAM protein [Clostridiales bacterium]
MYYYSLNEYLKKEFGQKVYKISLNGNMGCPNRDGTIGIGGCIFCSSGGSGDFAPSGFMPIGEQIENAKQRIKSKYDGDKYIAYFQAYTNTYAPVSYLKELFEKVIDRDDIVAVSIATRPDCLQDDVIDLIEKLNNKKPVWIELGLQTSNESTARYIRRGYKNECFEIAVRKLKKIGVHIVAHIILGLPNESEQDILGTANYVAHSGVSGIKIQLLHILNDTDLYLDYQKGVFDALTMEQYIDLLCKVIERLPQDMVVHRITGDGPKKLLVAPLWSGDKKRVLNNINQKFLKINLKQGRLFEA